jgi:hypothetical protein
MLGWIVTGKASAEHGSALRSCPLPCAEGGGEGWGGVALRRLQHYALRGLRRSHNSMINPALKLHL